MQKQVKHQFNEKVLYKIIIENTPTDTHHCRSIIPFSITLSKQRKSVDVFYQHNRSRMRYIQGNQRNEFIIERQTTVEEAE